MGGSRASELVEGHFAWGGAVPKMVTYDALGHGDSGDSTVPEDYTWKNLGVDLVNVSNATCGDTTTVCIGGASMGCAATLHAACTMQHRVSALILCIPPPCYEDRTVKREFMSQLGTSLAKEGGFERYVKMNRAARPVKIFGEAGFKEVWEAPAFHKTSAASVMKGAALSDFPSKEALQGIEVPALVLAWPDDSMHPVRSAETLAGLLPQGTLHIAASYDDVRNWPALVESFLAKNCKKGGVGGERKAEAEAEAEACNPREGDDSLHDILLESTYDNKGAEGRNPMKPPTGEEIGEGEDERIARQCCCVLM